LKAIIGRNTTKCVFNSGHVENPK